MAQYEVYASGVGTVYRGADHDKAERAAKTHAAAGHRVVWTTRYAAGEQPTYGARDCRGGRRNSRGRFTRAR
jgi:hypothetical protein